MPTAATALVHDYLLVMRGAERSFAAIGECWPTAPIYTLLYDAAGTDRVFAGRDVSCSYLQRLRLGQKGFRRLLPFFPGAVERLHVEASDLIVSSSSAFAHGVHAPEGTPHVAYCYTPFRYAWFESDRALEEVPRVARPVLRRVLKRIRHWDREVSQRVSHYIAISELTRERVQRCYGRDASVVHPPVEVERFSVGEAEDFFLVVAELVPHKRVENALRAAQRAGLPIRVVGGGPELERLRRDYRDGATFLGRVSDERLADLYSRARALVVPNIEEFGIAAVEAQAAGRPVLAADGGGVRETVVPGTGVLVKPDDVEALAEAMTDVNWDSFDPATISDHASHFSRDSFKRRFAAEVARLTGIEAPILNGQRQT